jgi:sodium transport system permease protein
MMGTIFTVFIKEVVDNIRDRRTLASALIMGPIFGPVLFSFVINLSVERSLESAENTLELPVIGQEYAPNLLSYLSSRNIDAIDGPEDMNAAMDAVKTGAHDVVLVIPEEFGEQLADMVPAKVEIVADQANNDAERDARRVRNALRRYNQQLAGLRVVARGINPMALQPLNIDEVDVSTPSGRSAMLLGMMSYFFIFAALMGGMYLRRPASESAALSSPCCHCPSPGIN